MTPEDFRAKAAEARKIAAEQTDPILREQWERVAADWMSLAEGERGDWLDYLYRAPRPSGGRLH